MPFARLRRFLALVILVTAAALPAGAWAQAVGQAGSGIVAEQRQVLDGLSKQADELERRIASSAEEDARLVEIRLKLEELGRELLTSAVAFRPRLSEINARIEQLGPPPAEGQPPEPDIVTSERAGTGRRKGRDQRGARRR